jgi:hypothetical protein
MFHFTARVKGRFGGGDFSVVISLFLRRGFAQRKRFAQQNASLHNGTGDGRCALAPLFAAIGDGVQPQIAMTVSATMANTQTIDKYNVVRFDRAPRRCSRLRTKSTRMPHIADASANARPTVFMARMLMPSF